jgi:hypothetical protein
MDFLFREFVFVMAATGSCSALAGAGLVMPPT